MRREQAEANAVAVVRPDVQSATIEAHALTDATIEAHALTEATIEAHALTDAMTEAHALTDAMTEAHALTDAMTEAHALITDVMTGAHALTDAMTEAHALTDVMTEAHALTDAMTEAHALITDAMTEDHALTDAMTEAHALITDAMTEAHALITDAMTEDHALTDAMTEDHAAVAAAIGATAATGVTTEVHVAAAVAEEEIDATAAIPDHAVMINRLASAIVMGTSVSPLAMNHLACVGVAASRQHAEAGVALALVVAEAVLVAQAAGEWLAVGDEETDFRQHPDRCVREKTRVAPRLMRPTCSCSKRISTKTSLKSGR